MKELPYIIMLSSIVALNAQAQKIVVGAGTFAIVYQPDELGVDGYTAIRDIWTQKDLGRFESVIKVKLPPHGVKLVKIR